MTKKAQKSAPAATATTTEEAPEEAPGAAVVPEAAAPIQIPPKVLKQAEALGIDLQQIIDWAQNVEKRLLAADINFQKIGQFLDRMEPLVKLGEQIQQRQTQGIGTPAGPPADVARGDIIGMIQEGMRLAGGGGADEEMMKMQKEMMSLSIQSMKQGIDFTNAIKNAIVSKITSKAVGEVV